MYRKNKLINLSKAELTKFEVSSDFFDIKMKQDFENSKLEIQLENSK